MQLDVKFNSPLWQTLPSKIDMHLNDKHCKPFLVNSSHVLIKTSHYNCGTKSKVTRDHLIFTNTFIAREETGTSQVVSFLPDVKVVFRCTYDRKKAPLQLDKLHTSPGEVPTYYGLPVELRCAFKYGAYPVRAVITHEGKIVARQENNTQTVTATVKLLKKEHELYTCLAEDANHKKMIYNIEITLIDPSSISLGGRDISCTRDEMQLTLSRLTYPWLHPKYFDMHLLDNNCGLFHVNFTHIMVKTTYKECKTTRRNIADGVIIYDNILMAFVRFQPGQVITRVPDVFFPFQCRFDPKKSTSIPSKTSDPKEPLTLVKSKSSPPVVKTYKKFDTRLICAFKGGHSPVNITLTRRGRRLTDKVVVKGKILYGTVKTDHWAAFGSYKCMATDAKGNQVKYRINLKKVEPNDLTSAGVTVTCKDQYMDVALNRLVYPWLIPESLHMSLIQSNCTVYNFTDMQIRIQAPLYGCGTSTLWKNEFVLESRNMFIAREKRPPGFRITYLPDMHFPFICRYEITRSAGKTVLKSLEPLTLDQSMSSSRKIFSPLNMAIKLTCVFHGGEPPVQVSISRHKKAIARAQSRMLSFVLRPRSQDGGSYVCQATDAGGETVRHVINLGVPVNGAVFDKEAAVIECGSQFTTITLDRAKYPWFNPERMRVHLNNPVCEPSFVNTTHVRFNMPLGGCGSRHITSPRKVIFTNRVFFVEESYHHGYSEKETKTLMEIYFLCKYRRTDFLSERLSQKRKRLL